MNKTLEFVEKATIANQRRLEQHKRDLEYYKEDVSLIDYGAKIFHLEHDIEHIEKIVLPNLQQIKIELEAWEIIKREILITDGGVIHLVIEDDNIDYEIVIQALEVKDE